MSNTNEKNLINKSRNKVRLIIVDVLLYFIAASILLVFDIGRYYPIPVSAMVEQMLLGALCIIVCRLVAGVYKQIWRYGFLYSYIRLLVADCIGGLVYLVIERILPIFQIEVIRILAIVALSLLFAIIARMIYFYAHQKGRDDSKLGQFMRAAVKFIGGVYVSEDSIVREDTRKEKIAIIGAGRNGARLAEELINNPLAQYYPVCFVDVSEEKVDREIFGIRVLNEKNLTPEILSKLGIMTVVFALPKLDEERRKQLYDFYSNAGCNIKTYDYAMMEDSPNGRLAMRDFAIEDLLFRNAVEVVDDNTRKYYHGKKVLISGGGGSIGSELARQIAAMEPQQIIILDVYENGAYDLQQELRIKYGTACDVRMEILSVCDYDGLEKVFTQYHPDIVLHAAAHKHVPLMEHNVCEAIKNNISGTHNIVDLSDKYGVEHFIMISTDKAVNPTNVMGATKRFCELMVMNKSRSSKTVFTATRFGNVLGSAGSVIPLFKRQISAGGPITITDKRIIRYFMTIPEAAQLVLKSGAMAKQGELFVLDMGNPVKIIDLAENLIKLSGLRPYKDIDIVETGLRPGEKMYEELLVKNENLTKTKDSKIFIEKDVALTDEEIGSLYESLVKAALSGDEDRAKAELKLAVPTYTGEIKTGDNKCQQ